MTQGPDDEVLTKKRKPLPHAFKPGNPGGPGRTKGIPIYRPKINPENFKEMIDKYLNMSVSELKENLADESLSGLEHVVMSAILSGKKHGDMSKLDCLVNRLIGKIVDKVEVSVPKPHKIEKIEGSSIELGAHFDR